MIGSIGALFAGCAVCAANDHEYGWFILAGTVLLGAVAVAGLMVWHESRSRG